MLKYMVLFVMGVGYEIMYIGVSHVKTWPHFYSSHSSTTAKRDIFPSFPSGYSMFSTRYICLFPSI